MGHGPCTFKEVDLTRALRAAQKAGLDVERAELARDGKIVLIFKQKGEMMPNEVHVTGRNGERVIAFANFHRLPGDTPQRDTNLNLGEVIVAVELPSEGFATNYTYLKIRDRLSYAFALVSVAAGLVVEDSRIKVARLALGGVAHKPWRDTRAEVALQGQAATQAAFSQAADIVLRDARGFGHNTFKIELARRAIVRALTQAAQGTPQSQSNKKIA